MASHKFTVFGGIAFVVLLLIGVYAPVSAQFNGLDLVAHQNISMRGGPSVSFPEVGLLEVGMTIRLDGHIARSLWARGISPSGVVGWVSADLFGVPYEQIYDLPDITEDTPFTLTAPSGAAPTAPQAPAPVVDSGAPPPAIVEPQAVVAPGGTIAANVVTRANLRTGSNLNSGILFTVAVGTQVQVEGRDASFLWVRAVLPDGSRGWLFAEYLTIEPGEVATLPIVEGGASGATSQAAVVPPPADDTASEAPAAAPVVAVANSAPVRGFNLGGHVQSLSSTTVSAMQQAGMTWVKTQWRYTPGQDPSALAGWINSAHGSGFRLLVGIVGASSDINQGSGYFAQYAAFVGGVAAQGADAIEIWNEMNIDREWPSGSIDAALYTDLLRQSFQAIKAANPNTLVISGAPAPTGFFGGCSPAGCDDAPFIRGMAAAGAANYMDCIGVHYNEGILPPNQNSGDPRGNSGFYTRYYSGMVNTYYNAFGGARPLCFTELGYLTPEGYGPLDSSFGWAANVTVAQQAQWLDQVASIAGNSGRVRLLIIWNVDFTGSFGADPIGGYAIIRPGGGCPACQLLGS
ncbi:MAG: SH3 domain-containing protein [Burkholderiales bacterium]|nr:SH3 domain-containing protein [Anaerolineae bacterium]